MFPDLGVYASVDGKDIEADVPQTPPANKTHKEWITEQLRRRGMFEADWRDYTRARKKRVTTSAGQEIEVAWEDRRGQIVTLGHRAPQFFQSVPGAFRLNPFCHDVEAEISPQIDRGLQPSRASTCCKLGRQYRRAIASAGKSKARFQTTEGQIAAVV